MARTDAFLAATTAFSSSSSRAAVTMSLARHRTVWVLSERLEATKCVTRSSSVGGRCWSKVRELALLADEAGDGGEAMATRVTARSGVYRELAGASQRWYQGLHGRAESTTTGRGEGNGSVHRHAELPQLPETRRR
jgi:hypothetical protein